MYRIAFSHFSLNVLPWYTTVSKKNVSFFIEFSIYLDIRYTY